MLGAIEAFVTSALLRGETRDLGPGLRELAGMIIRAYLGDDAAGEELDLLVAAA
jgi:hypothetical protein